MTSPVTPNSRGSSPDGLALASNQYGRASALARKRQGLRATPGRFPSQMFGSRRAGEHGRRAVESHPGAAWVGAAPAHPRRNRCPARGSTARRIRGPRPVHGRQGRGRGDAEPPRPWKARGPSIAPHRRVRPRLDLTSRPGAHRRVDPVGQAEAREYLWGTEREHLADPRAAKGEHIERDRQISARVTVPIGRSPGPAARSRA